MCVASTAKRRRRQMKSSNKYRMVSPEKSARINARLKMNANKGGKTKHAASR